jgi:flagellar motor protein MotB
MPKKPPPPKQDDIPAWFMTYSDVITLLMTFFILLLTFATTEPEMFEKMQITLFGRGSNGVAGEVLEGVEKSSLILRDRPPASRLAMKGSEMPPIHSDASTETISAGLAGLDDERCRDPMVTYAIEVPLRLLVSDDNEIHPRGRQLLRMLGRQLRKLPFHAAFVAQDEKTMPRLLALVAHLTDQERVPPAKIGISIDDGTGLAADRIRIVTNWHTSE